MRDWQSQSHVKWYCKYHVVFVPKYRRRAIYGAVRRQIGRILRELCRQAGIELGEGACDGRPRPPVYEYPAEVQCGEHGGVIFPANDGHGIKRLVEPRTPWG